MKIYTVAAAKYEPDGSFYAYAVLEHFKTHEAALNYMIMLAEGNIKYPGRNEFLNPNIEMPKNTGMATVYYENGNPAYEYAVWKHDLIER